MNVRVGMYWPIREIVIRFVAEPENATGKWTKTENDLPKERKQTIWSTQRALRKLESSIICKHREHVLKHAVTISTTDRRWPTFFYQIFVTLIGSQVKMNTIGVTSIDSQLESVSFRIFTPDDITRLSVLEIHNAQGIDKKTSVPVSGGLCDNRLGKQYLPVTTSHKIMHNALLIFRTNRQTRSLFNLRTQ